jgi:AcrR family transcriptional regulator
MTEDRETRARLLRAGERLFAERGFKKVTVREICTAADANVAAINYHFGDKLGLYREVLNTAIARMRATTDAAREAGRGCSPEESLRRSILIFVSRVLASGGETVHRLIMREVNDPTPALDAVVEQGIRPRLEHLSRIVADIIGVSTSDPRVRRSVASIQAQTVAYLPNPIADRIGFMKPSTVREVEAIAEHIAEFSLAGVRQMARSTRSTRQPSRPRAAVVR